MNVRQKSVYYCEFCKKHGLSRYHMEAHESRCTLNPERKCRWTRYKAEHSGVNLPALVAKLAQHDPFTATEVDWVHDEVDGCPACMLAAFRQAGIDRLFDERGLRIWDYQEEVARFRDEERKEAWNDQW